METDDVGWSSPAFAPVPTQWTRVNASPSATTLPTRAIAMPLSTVINEVHPTKVTALGNGAFLYKFPRNFVGTVKIAPLLSAKTNSSLTVLLGEWLDPGAPDYSQHRPGGRQPTGQRAYPSISDSVDG
eukprot:SAG31_NODE_24323_length_484_cov_0.896104_1_plen_127_part_10